MSAFESLLRAVSTPCNDYSVAGSDGELVAEGALLPLKVIEDRQTPKRHLPETS